MWGEGIENIGKYSKQTAESELWRPVSIALVLLVVFLLGTGALTLTALLVRWFGWWLLALTFLLAFRLTELGGEQGALAVYWRGWMQGNKPRSVALVLLLAAVAFIILEGLVERPFTLTADIETQRLWIGTAFGGTSLPLPLLWFIVPFIAVIDVATPLLIVTLTGRLLDEIGYPNYRNSIVARAGMANADAPVTYSGTDRDASSRDPEEKPLEADESGDYFLG